MVGDWVLVRMALFSCQGKIPSQITGIICDDFFETTISPSVGGECISPIPLTIEILEQNGFYHEDNVGHVLEHYNYEIIYDMWDHELRILENREQILKIKTFDEMCVHELQHALKLCGIEKDIEI